MIRAAQRKDIPRIAEIIVFGKRVAYRDIFQNDMVTFNELQVMDLVEEYHRNPALIKNMLVYDDGIVKGVINREYINDTVEISEFYIEPFFKRQGIGRKLIQYVLTEEREKQMKKIFLWVIADNISARRFYEANGLCASGDTCLIEGTDKTDMCYEMKL
ncbi:MAG: GNAT family N-acetyltransferase [Lachnospiraceae bacterium]|nr:GNAT family N-acetyltransferase [Lachnospiraceae bacterium]